jgi:hypothetical protein
MQQSISMLDFRKSPGEAINEVFYNKRKIILERSKKQMAVIVPIGLYQKLFQDEDIEMYTNEMIKEFEKEDKITEKLSVKIKRLLS